MPVERSREELPRRASAVALERLDEVQCVVPEGKRRRKSRLDGQVPKYGSGASAEGDEDSPILSLLQDVEVFDSVTAVHELDQEVARSISVVDSEKPALLNLDLHNHLHQQYLPIKEPLRRFSLPQYLRPVPQHNLDADLSYLSSRGALQIPGTGLRNQLLRCYAQYVHPYLPLLDLQDFIVAIERDDGSNPISMLLFQAVMFAGTGFIDMGYLIAEGFDTRKAARRAFFQKVKLLYDFDYEVDRVAVVQAVLLMTYWFEAPDDPKDVWHWLGIAVSLASTIGIDNDNSRSSLDLKTQRLWKRIWWSCYLRDRLISLGLRRPLRIRDGGFSVSMLELDDFEIAPLSVEHTSLLGLGLAVNNSSTSITLAKLCIALINLCKCVSQVLDVQYCLMGQKVGDTQNTTVRLVPKQSAADLSDLRRCDRALKEWHLSTPPELHYFQPNNTKEASVHASDGGVISLHRSLLTGIYLTIISALHRPYTLSSSNGMAIGAEVKELSAYRVREAANEIAEMYNDLYTQDLIRYLPSTAVSILLPALIIHLLNLKSEDVSTRQASGRRFQICMLALQRLREMYSSADFAFSILDALTHRAQINIPIASPPDTTRGSFSASVSIDHAAVTANHNPPLLTPPPEATWSAKRILFSSTLAPEERRLIAAFAGPNDQSNDWCAVERLPPPGMRDLSPECLSEVEEENKYHSSARYGCAVGDDDEEQPMSDFDALIDLEAFGPMRAAAVSAAAADESGIFAEMNLAWLNGMDNDAHGNIDEKESHDQQSPAAAIQVDGAGNKQEEEELQGLGMDHDGLYNEASDITGNVVNDYQG
ncbi:hypothetical protein DV738_g3643, partial [Chaetothyriales sp. CBS 135597]